MFDMIKPSSIWDDMFRMADALAVYPSKEKSLENNGLRRIISRPHNIVNVKNKDGDIVAQRLEVVTTPFKKNEVKVTLDSDNMLTVQCGNEDKEEIRQPNEGVPMGDENDHYVYKGISTQTYTFSIKLGSNIDKNAIKAKNDDGVLVVTLPFKKKELPEVAQIEVE